MRQMVIMVKSRLIESSLDIRSGKVTFKSEIPADLTFDEALLFSEFLSEEFHKALNRFFFERKPTNDTEEEIPFN